MTHAEMNELYELYALGVLEPELATEIDRHLRDQCEYCSEHLRSALELTAALAGTAEPVSPPARLRERVLSAVRPAGPSRRWLFAAAALAAVCVALLTFGAALRREMQGMQRQIAALSRERDQLRLALEILSRPETRAVQFGQTETVPHGRVLVNRDGGVVFVGSGLPQISSNQTFELWLVPQAGAPQAAGLFRPNQTGAAVHLSPVLARAGTKAAAVSIEPREGSTAPSTKPILVIPLG